VGLTPRICLRHVEGEYVVRTSREPPRAAERPLYFPDEAAARRFIGGLLLDGDASRELGRLYHRLDVGAFIDLTAEQVVHAIASQLAAGTIRVAPVASETSGLTKVLPVPYFVQPTSNTCQSTCLKMMATYFEESVVRTSTGAAARDIPDIWKDINESKDRPVAARNAHANMKWWLERHFPSLAFEYITIADEAGALEKIVEFIDGGMPVLMSVSHVNVEGHIVLVVGYENYIPLVSSPDMNIVVHDPYGRFDPSLLSKTFGKRRWDGGMSLKSGGETGVGEQCRVPMTSVSRRREGDAAKGTYHLLSARR
jgi:hypothetical protein